ncbi:MAG: ABC transporter permease [Clostridia bacterium]|nr:ABC transporter permease [Clostridia bacterium]
MKQFGKILKFELNGYLKNKIFVGVTLFLVLAIAIVIFFPNLKEFLRSDGGAEEGNQRPVMLVYTEDGDLASTLREAFEAAFDGYYDVQTAEGTVDDVKRMVIGGSAECAFALEGISAYTYYVNNLSMYDGNTAVAEAVLQELCRADAMAQAGLTPGQAEKILSVAVEGNTETLGKDQNETVLYTYIMILVLYMAIILYGQMVAIKVAAEKDSRAMEVLITSAKPASMMFGKVLASCLAGLMQLAVIFGAALVLYRVNQSAWGGSDLMESIFDIPVGLLGYMLMFFVLGFLIYAFLFGAVGSAASKTEDTNTSILPLEFLILASFFVVNFSITGGGNINSTLMKICSFVPFSSPMAMFTRICMSEVPGYEIAISVAILIGSVVGVGFLAAKIYRVGVLLYGTAPKIGEVVKVAWKA